MANLTGTNAANIIIGGIDGDIIKGLGGSDELFGGAGNDDIRGGAGADLLSDGAGTDRLLGGSGADTFAMSADGDLDRILDWEAQDLIDLTEWGVTDIADLIITALPNGQVRIEAGAETLLIKGMGGSVLSAALFTPDKFVFAAPPPRVLDFEGLDDPLEYGAPIEATEPGHGGLTWSDFFYFAEMDDYAVLDGTPLGIDNRTTSGNNVAVNGFAEDVSFSAAGNFDFEQASFGAIWNDGLELRIVGLDNGQIVGEQTVILNTTGSTLVQLDDQVFDSVDEVQFFATGGIRSAYANAVVPVGDPTTHFYMDDLVLA